MNDGTIFYQNNEYREHEVTECQLRFNKPVSLTVLGELLLELGDVEVEILVKKTLTNDIPLP